MASMKQRRLLQLACAAAACLEGSASQQWEAVGKQEMQLTLLSTEGRFLFAPVSNAAAEGLSPLSSTTTISQSCSFSGAASLAVSESRSSPRAGSESVVSEAEELLRLAGSGGPLKLRDVLLLLLRGFLLADTTSGAEDVGRGFSEEQTARLRQALAAAILKVQSPSMRHPIWCTALWTPAATSLRASLACVFLAALLSVPYRRQRFRRTKLGWAACSPDS